MVLIDGKEFLSEEEKRLKLDRERKGYWKKWGPYVAERQWATVREDYSENGDAWSHFTHDMARSRVFRWGEDGIAGVSDTHGLENIAFAFWNENEYIHIYQSSNYRDHILTSCQSILEGTSIRSFESSRQSW